MSKEMLQILYAGKSRRKIQHNEMKEELQIIKMDSYRIKPEKNNCGIIVTHWSTIE